MRLMICVAAACTLAACNKTAEAPPAADNMAADTNATAPATPAALTTINETSWEFTDAKSKKTDLESIDASGKYITQEKDGGKHVDHGTAVMKDGKACFTSAMDKEGEVCWTDPKVAIGESGETTSDKGEKLTVKRVAYTPLTM
jgi:hypothetical protein